MAEYTLVRLTKNRYKVFVKTIEKAKSYDNVNYVMADINCLLKIVLKDGSGEFFTDIMSLTVILEKKGIHQV